jgi:hypothetical protein
MYVLAVWFVAIAMLIWEERRSGRVRRLKIADRGNNA